jgi:hypothetical protein
LLRVSFNVSQSLHRTPALIALNPTGRNPAIPERHSDEYGTGGLDADAMEDRELLDEQGIDAARHLEILVREPACVVGGEGESDAVVNDADIGVMPLFFGDLGDFVNEDHGIDEIFKRQKTLNLIPLQGPMRELLQPFGYLLSFQLYRHLRAPSD